MPRKVIVKPPEYFERIPDPSIDADAAEVVTVEQLRLRRCVRTLPVRERRVISWRYGLDGLSLTLEEISAQLGLSIATVHRIEKRALLLLSLSYTPAETVAHVKNAA